MPSKSKRARTAPNANCLTKKEAMEWIGCSREMLNKHIESGILPILWPNAKRCLHPEDVKTFMRGYKPRKRRKEL